MGAWGWGGHRVSRKDVLREEEAEEDGNDWEDGERHMAFSTAPLERGVWEIPLRAEVAQSSISEVNTGLPGSMQSREQNQPPPERYSGFLMLQNSPSPPASVPRVHPHLWTRDINAYMTCMHAWLHSHKYTYGCFFMAVPLHNIVMISPFISFYVLRGTFHLHFSPAQMVTACSLSGWGKEVSVFISTSKEQNYLLPHL